MSIFLFLTFIHEGYWRCLETSQQTSTSPGPIIHRPGAGLLQQGIEVWLFLVRVFAVVLFFLLMLKVFVFRWTTVYSWDQWRLSPQSLRWQVRGSFHIPLLKLLLLLLMFLFATRWWRWWLFVVRVLPLSEKVACSHTQWLRGGRRRTCGGETRDKTRVGENAENF